MKFRLKKIILYGIRFGICPFSNFVERKTLLSAQSISADISEEYAGKSEELESVGTHSENIYIILHR